MLCAQPMFMSADPAAGNEDYGRYFHCGDIAGLLASKGALDTKVARQAISFITKLMHLDPAKHVSHAARGRAQMKSV